jgi:hypothetical protein
MFVRRCGTKVLQLLWNLRLAEFKALYKTLEEGCSLVGSPPFGSSLLA